MPGIGQTTLIGGAVVGAVLSGFYVSLKRRQSKKEQLGIIPHYERVLAHNVSTRPKKYRGEVISPPNSPH